MSASAVRTLHREVTFYGTCLHRSRPRGECIVAFSDGTLSAPLIHEWRVSGGPIGLRLFNARFPPGDFTFAERFCRSAVQPENEGCEILQSGDASSDPPGSLLRPKVILTARWCATLETQPPKNESADLIQLGEAAFPIAWSASDQWKLVFRVDEKSDRSLSAAWVAAPADRRFVRFSISDH